jgi:hypothetical protein
MSSMDMNAMNFTGAGTLMNMEDLIEKRKKKGQCVTCGRQTHTKKIFKMIPLTVPDEVLDGRCLRCQPLESKKTASLATATHKIMIAARATQAFQATIKEPSAQSSNLLLSQRPVPDATAGKGKSSRLLDARPLREPSRSRLDVTAAISTRRLNITPANDAGATMNRGLLHSPEMSISERTVGSRVESSTSIDSEHPKLGSSSAQGETSRTNSNRSIISNSESTLNEHQNESSTTGSEPNISYKKDLLDRTSTQEDNEQALQILADLSNPIDAIRVMQKYPRSSLVQIEGCKILECKLLDSCSTTLSGDEQESLIRCILDASINHSTDAPVQEMVLKLLSLIPFSDDDKAVGRHVNGGVEHILSAMKNFPDNSKLQQYGCSSLSRLSPFERCQLEILDHGGISVLICALTTHSLDATIQEAACRTLLNLCSNVNVKEVVSNDGGIDSISIAMAMHPTNLLIQELGCEVLCQLSANNDENKVRIEESGGIDAIITAMQVHRGELNLQKKACLVLSNLAIDATNKVIIGESNGIDVILNSMRDHKSDAELQELACRALWTLSVSPQNKELISQSGGIPVVINMMQDHTENAGVQEKGCGCLSNLASNSEDNKRIIVEEEGIDAIVLAMVLHPDERLVQEKAVNCLKKLTCEPYLDALRASGVVSLVEQAAEKFPSNCRTVADQMLELLL